MSNFTDNILDRVHEMVNGSVKKNKLFYSVPPKVKKDYPGLIAIAIATLLLLLLTWKMAGEIGKHTQQRD